jgi:hypothetical protein
MWRFRKVTYAPGPPASASRCFAQIAVSPRISKRLRSGFRHYSVEWTTSVWVRVALAIMLLTFIAFLSPRARTPITSPETAVLKQFMKVNMAQAEHYSRYQKFASSMQELDHSGDVTLLPFDTNGYDFAMSATAIGYSITANRQHCESRNPGRNFYSYESLVIHARPCPDAADATDPVLR